MRLVNDGTSRPPTYFGSEASDYMLEGIKVGADEFGGKIALRLVDAGLGTPFSYLPESVAAVAADPHRARVDDGLSNQYLAAALHQWMGALDPGRTRVLLFEEYIRRFSDASVNRSEVHIGENLYRVATASTAPGEIENTFGWLSDQSIGLVSRPPAGSMTTGVLDERAVDAAVTSAVAVLVFAWDGEGLLVAPISDKVAFP